MDLESILLIKCSSCNLFLDDQNLNLHTCISLLCSICKEKETTCSNCNEDLSDGNFIQISRIMDCFYFFDCQSYSDGFCSCVNKNLCEKHIIQVHQNINKDPCKPVYRHAREEKKNCASCSTMKAQFKNKETSQEICINCAVNVDKSLIMTINDTYTEFHAILGNEKQNIEKLMVIMQDGLKLIKDKMNDEKKHFDEKLPPVVAFFNDSMAQNERLIGELETKIRESSDKLKRFNDNMITIKSIINQADNHGIISQQDIIEKAKSWLSTLPQCAMNHEFRFLSSSIEIVRNIQDLSEPNTKLSLIISSQENIYHKTFTLNIDTSDSDAIASHDLDAENPIQVDQQSFVYQGEEFNESSTSFDTTFRSEGEPSPKKSRNQDHESNEHERSSAKTSSVLNHDALDSSDISGFHILKVTNVRDPAWIHIEEPEMVNKRSEILAICAELPEDYFTRVDCIKQGDIVIVKDHPSFKEPIKRGQIVCYNLSRNKWKVKLLDYGKSIEVDKQQIYHAKHEIFKCGATVFKAKLVGVKPRSCSIYLDKPKNNAAYLIKSSLIPNDDHVYVKKIIKDGDSWFCIIKSKINDTIIDWSKTIISHNLAIAIKDKNGSPSCDVNANNYCYLYHFYGKCNGFCNRWHVCSWCVSEVHPLCKCKLYIEEETKKATGFISEVES